MGINLMIEGQEDVTWAQWLALADAAEDAGLEGLFRSDHYASVQGRTERGSLDAWATLSALAAVTEDILLGTMVSPTSFRHPSVLAKQVVTADHVSGGRVQLGIGAGWNELEHRMYGFDFHDTSTRYDVLAEQLEIITRQWTEDAVDFSGTHYTLESCGALPKPLGHIHLIMGGAAGPRGARLAATYADEYNTTFPSIDAVTERRGRLDAACEEAGRDPLPLSIMTGCILGEDDADVRRRAERLMQISQAEGDVEGWLDGLRHEWVVGTVDQAQERLDAYREAGVSRFMLQHQLHDDLDMVELMGRLR
ncbi:TIGR03560 family F420-dependent LLM class oxidoreductase [Euzebya sp.]|uniref:TIGR03560 family F420-dependent LLM class oxidoreductase n=1 Tax=Euzebya sp. TaxID=1971409 RepID=UPI003517B595